MAESTSATPNSLMVLSKIVSFSNQWKEVCDDVEVKWNGLRPRHSASSTIDAIIHHDLPYDIEAVDQTLNDPDIRTILYSCSGSRSNACISAFKFFAKSHIKRLEEPSLESVSIVYGELKRISEVICQEQLNNRYPRLGEGIRNSVSALLDQARKQTENSVKDLIAMERCYINMKHPNFADHQASCAVSKQVVHSINLQSDADDTSRCHASGSCSYSILRRGR